jgi:hypothetical protein
MAQSDYATSAIPAPITGANSKPSTNPVRGTYAGLIARLAGHGPPRIPHKPHSIDIEERPHHAKKGPSTLSAHLTAILNYTKQNLSGGLRQGDALLSHPVPAVADAAGRVA